MLQGQSVAGTLCRALQAQARAWHQVRLVFEINLEPLNLDAVAFYQRLGFEQVGHADLLSGKRVG